MNRLLGTALDSQEQRDLLAWVGIETTDPAPAERIAVALRPEPLFVDAGPGAAVSAIVPTWRRDIAIEADLAEEIARVRGYELIPSVTPDTAMPEFRPSPLEVRELVRDTLAGAGVTEVVTSALVAPRHLEAFSLIRDVRSIGDEPQPEGTPIGVGNPLSRDHSILRRYLVPSLLDVVGTNLRHGTLDVAVFEIGKGYAGAPDGPHEWWRLGFALVGAAEPPAWNRLARAHDIDDAKGVVELLAARLDLGQVRYAAESDEPAFHPGRTVRVEIDGRLAGIVGELHPSIVEAWDLRTASPVIVGEVAIRGLAEGRLAAERAPAVGRFPEVDRDLAIVVPETVRAADAEAYLVNAGGALLVSVRLFDVYRGIPLDATEKSLNFRLRFGAGDRTLTETEVDAAMSAVIGGLAGIGGRLRA